MQVILYYMVMYYPAQLSWLSPDGPRNPASSHHAQPWKENIQKACTINMLVPDANYSEHKDKHLLYKFND